jgi:hypothetical protein
MVRRIIAPIRASREGSVLAIACVALLLPVMGRAHSPTVASATPAFVYPVNLIGTKELVHLSDVIVIGALTSVIDQGPTVVERWKTLTSRLKSGTIAVDRRLKGAADASSINIRMRVVEHVSVGHDHVRPGTFGMFCLKRVGDALEFVDHDFPVIVALPNTPVEGNTDLDRVTSALAFVLKSPQATQQQKLGSLRQLSTVGTFTGVDALRAGLKDRDRAVQLRSAASLLSNHDVSGLPLVVGTRFARSEGSTNQVDIAASNLSGAIRIALEDDDEDFVFQVISTLARVTGNTTQTSSRAALGARRSELIAYWTRWARGQ